jgi:hypothetical protein
LFAKEVELKEEMDILIERMSKSNIKWVTFIYDYTIN